MTRNPKCLRNAVCVNNAVHFNLRLQEQINCLWEDIELKSTTNGDEYLEFSERATKTRNGADRGNTRDVPPRMFAVPGNSNCPVQMYKAYREHRPNETLAVTSRFYLRTLDEPASEVWYSNQPLGKSKHAEVMQELTQMAGISGRKTSHSARKTFATTLVEENVSHNEIAQLGGWKNVATVAHYAKPSIDKQKSASHTLSKAIAPITDEDKENSECVVSPDQEKEVYDVQFVHPVNTQIQTSNQSSSNPLSIFSGASVNGGVVNIDIHYNSK